MPKESLVESFEKQFLDENYINSQYIENILKIIEKMKTASSIMNDNVKFQNLASELSSYIESNILK